MAGFGGQGIMFMGKLLTTACMSEGKEVTWLPSYGPQMRGGIANCSVVVSDRSIASPYVDEPSSLMVMTRPSLDKYEPAVKSGGQILINSSLVKIESERKDLHVHKIPASEIAEQIGDIRVSNMAILGAFIGIKPLIPIDTLLDSLAQVLPTRHKNMLDSNRTALNRGFELAMEGFKNG